MAGSLLMSDKDVVDAVGVVVERVIYGHDSPARVSKNKVYPFLKERFHQGLAAGKKFNRFYCFQDFCFYACFHICLALSLELSAISQPV
ncbi:hypothetical protein D9M69_707590 [compost metagenome]